MEKLYARNADRGAKEGKLLGAIRGCYTSPILVCLMCTQHVLRCVRDKADEKIKQIYQRVKCIYK